MAGINTDLADRGTGPLVVRKVCPAANGPREIDENRGNPDGPSVLSVSPVHSVPFIDILSGYWEPCVRLIRDLDKDLQ